LIQDESFLVIIPARGGSKGLPRKNILPLAGKPMIYYTIDAARGVTGDDNICVSTDDAEIIQVVEDYGLKVNFVRPTELATDTAGSREVILHAIDYYKNNLGRTFSKVCLLQPTSPLRTSQHIQGAFELWNDDLDMVVSVKETKANPYFNLFEEDEDGYLRKSKEGNFTRRQDTPKAWEYNGAIYIINTKSILIKSFSGFDKIKKYIMSVERSVDVDDEIDYKLISKFFEESV
jgi:N-acylneuraminate cytidylyltransferase